MPGAPGLTVVLEITNGVRDTDIGGGRCVISVEVRYRYLLDEGGEDMRVDERGGC
jgi:hypothetical protein